MSRQFHRTTGRHVGRSGMQPWKHSPPEMAKGLQDEEMPPSARVGIAYPLPQTSERIDFVITGEDTDARPMMLRWAGCGGPAHSIGVPRAAVQRLRPVDVGRRTNAHWHQAVAGCCAEPCLNAE